MLAFSRCYTAHGDVFFHFIHLYADKPANRDGSQLTALDFAANGFRRYAQPSSNGGDVEQAFPARRNRAIHDPPPSIAPEDRPRIALVRRRERAIVRALSGH